MAHHPSCPCPACGHVVPVYQPRQREGASLPPRLVPDEDALIAEYQKGELSIPELLILFETYKSGFYKMLHRRGIPVNHQRARPKPQPEPPAPSFWEQVKLRNAEIVRRCQAGEHPADIADEIGVTTTRIYQILNEFDWKGKRVKKAD